MKNENMKKLVRFLSKFIGSDDFFYRPQNTQYSWYIDIFLEEHKNGNKMPLGRFSDELGRRLIAEEQFQQLDPNQAGYNPHSPEQKRYELFITIWSAWDILHNELLKQRKLQ